MRSRPEMEQQVHRCFLLRCSLKEHEPGDPSPVWQFMVMQVGCEEPRRMFASLNAVMTFLRAELADASSSPCVAKGARRLRSRGVQHD